MNKELLKEEILKIFYFVEHDLSVDLDPELMTDLIMSDELNSYFNWKMKGEDLILIFETELGEGKIILKDFDSEVEEIIFNQNLLNLQEVT